MRIFRLFDQNDDSVSIVPVVSNQGDKVYLEFLASPHNDVPPWMDRAAATRLVAFLQGCLASWPTVEEIDNHINGSSPLASLGRESSEPTQELDARCQCGHTRYVHQIDWCTIPGCDCRAFMASAAFRYHLIAERSGVRPAAASHVTPSELLAIANDQVGEIARLRALLSEREAPPRRAWFNFDQPCTVLAMWDDSAAILIDGASESAVVQQENLTYNRPPAPSSPSFDLDAWNHSRLDACRITGTTYERQNDEISPAARAYAEKQK